MEMYTETIFQTVYFKSSRQLYAPEFILHSRSHMK